MDRDDRLDRLEKLIEKWADVQEDFIYESRQFRLEQKETHLHMTGELGRIANLMDGTEKTPGIVQQVTHLTAILNGAKMSWKILFALAGMIGVFVTIANGALSIFGLHFWGSTK